jgi:hypothetical protein
MEIRQERQLGILVAGPHWGDAEFYGNWLLAAARAEAFWKKACSEPDFGIAVDRLSVVYRPEFGIAAYVLLSLLKDHRTSFVIDLNEDEVVDYFVMMSAMGFFVRSGQSYQMAIPTDLSLAKVKAAALNYAQTEDAEYSLHPELLVSSMPLAEALQCQMRQLAISDFQLDRNVVPFRKHNQTPC